MEEFGKNQLREEICRMLSIPKLTPLIEKQVRDMVTELGVSYLDIAQALAYFLDIKKGKYESMYGIGILRNVLPESKAFFEKIKEEKQKQIKSVEQANKQPDIILNVKETRKRRKIKTINIDELDLD